MGWQKPPEINELACASHVRLLLTKHHRNRPPFDPDPTTDFKHFTVHGLNSHRHWTHTYTLFKLLSKQPD